MSGSYFNEEQQDWMRHLDSLSPEAKCWCGWCIVGKCDTPNPCPPESAMADRMKVTCRCGGYPGKPDSRMFHRYGCSNRND